MSQLTKNQLKTDNNSSFPNNTTGYITPTILRDFNTNMIDSLVDEVTYLADSASFSGSIAQLQDFSSSLDATFATDAQLTALSSSVATTDAGQDTKINSLTAATSSYAISSSVAAITAVGIVTASVTNNTITFTKGNGTTFPITVATGSGGGGSVPSGTVSSSAQIAAFGYATTGSNTFTATQNINGDLWAVNPNAYAGANIYSAGNVNGSGSTYPGFTAIADTTSDPANVYGGFSVNNSAGTTLGGFVLNSYSPQYTNTALPMIIANGNNPGGDNTAIIWKANGQAEHWKKTNFKYGVDVTGSMNVSSSIIINGAGEATNALQIISGSVEVIGPRGNGGHFYTNLPITSSNGRINGTFIIKDLIVSGTWGGENSGSLSVEKQTTLSGSLLVTGSSTFTGSIQSNVSALTISSNTASLNPDVASFYTLQLVPSTATHLVANSVKPGLTISVKVATTGSGTLNLSSQFKQPSGSAYTATSTTGVDILTFVSFDSTAYYLTSVKNLI